MSPRPGRAARRVVISAGPTREYIDPVRYLSNESSGKMGFALAEAAAKAGHEVTLIAGPVHLPTPKGVERIDVVSARDMLKALRAAFQEADVLFMAAAVADFRPARKHAGKWKRKEQESGPVALELLENPDILATLGKRKGERTVIGFALETSDGVRRALAKMKRKNTDHVVLNGASALNADRTTVTILSRNGDKRVIADRTKAQVARELVRLIP